MKEDSLSNNLTQFFSYKLTKRIDGIFLEEREKSNGRKIEFQ